MKIFITGGTGFIGSKLTNFLHSHGHEVVLLLRPSEARRHLGNGFAKVVGESTEPGPWQEAVCLCDAAINLAGRPIAGKWDKAAKEEIRSSRILTTKNLVDAIPSGSGFRLLSTSAVGYYGDGGEALLDESAPGGSDFLATVARDWETEAMRAADKGAAVAITRFAIVLGRDGGALLELEKVTRRFAAGPIGGGRQWFSWIHIEDLLRALLFLIENPKITGPVNLCSPFAVRQGDFASRLAQKLHRPALLPTPAFALRMVLGEFADTLLFSQRMVPKKLDSAGFAFLYPEMEQALDRIYR
ncbi:TIGR01777 family protein [bacterium]|nr:MAG: TIGR01777 family protein [bacterium]